MLTLNTHGFLTVSENEANPCLEKGNLLTIKHVGGCVMLWGCVEASGSRNITQVDGKMDSSKYQQILEANVPRSVKKPQLKRGCILQQ